MPTIEERVADLESKMKPDLRDEMLRGFKRLDARFDRLESRFERLDDKVDRHFIWIVGIQLTMMIAFIGTLAAAYLR